MKDNKIIVYLSFIFFILLIPNLCALGIAPARATINFEPSLHKEITLRIINNQNQNLELNIYAEGKLKDYITIKEPNISISANESERAITYGVNLPASFDSPGVHEGEIIVLQPIKKGTASGTALTGSITVKSQLKVKVPYEGKYLESSLLVTKYDGKIQFTIPIKNVGTLNISRIYAEISIASQPTILTESIQLNSDESGKLDKIIDALPAGHYDAIAKIFYDEKSTQLNGTFDVEQAKKFLELKEVKVADFIFGEKAGLVLTFQNSNKEILKSVYAQFDAYDKSGSRVITAQTSTFDAPPDSTFSIPLALDLSGIRSDNYDVVLNVFYADTSKETKFVMTLSDSTISTSFTPTGAFVANLNETKEIQYRIIENNTAQASEKKASLMYVYVVIVIVVIIAVIYYLIRKRNEEEMQAVPVSKVQQKAQQQIQPQVQVPQQPIQEQAIIQEPKKTRKHKKKKAR